MDHISLIGVAVILFASTNIDDVFILLAFFADPKFKLRQIVVGTYIGIGALYGISVVASLISLVIPPAYIGFLGLAPIVIGLKELWELRKGADAGRDDSNDRAKPAAAYGNAIVVALVTIANGGDNIGIYTPVFATRSAYEIAFIGIVFAVVTGIWLWIAHWLTNHRTLGAPIRRYGRRLAPFVFIGLGLLILYEADVFELLRH
jgi:cadmium resistance protein CadD (predicted permease)